MIHNVQMNRDLELGNLNWCWWLIRHGSEVVNQQDGGIIHDEKMDAKN